jgi:hypothetical protein
MSQSNGKVLFLSVEEFCSKFNIETFELKLNTNTDKISCLLNEKTPDQEFLPISPELQANRQLMKDNKDSLRMIVPVSMVGKKEIADWQSACLILPKPGTGLEKFETFLKLY